MNTCFFNNGSSRVAKKYYPMDLEINDVEDRTHRCVCNVYTELGLLEQFAKRTSRLVQAETGFTVSLLGESY